MEKVERIKRVYKKEEKRLRVYGQNPGDGETEEQHRGSMEMC